MGKRRKRIKKKIAKEGLWSCVVQVLKHINTNICGVHRALIFELDIKNTEVPNVATVELSFQHASKQDIDALDEEQFPYDAKGKQYAYMRLERGDTCVLALHKGIIVGYLWMMKDEMELSEFHYLPLSSKRMYLYNAFVLPDYRRRGVCQAMDIYFYEMGKKVGKQCVVLIGIIHRRYSMLSDWVSTKLVLF
jgi:hypothetical protein